MKVIFTSTSEPLDFAELDINELFVYADKNRP